MQCLQAQQTIPAQAVLKRKALNDDASDPRDATAAQLQLLHPDADYGQLEEACEMLQVHLACCSRQLRLRTGSYMAATADGAK